MASGVMYAPSTAFSTSTWEYDGHPYDDRRPEYTPYPSSRPLPQPSQQQLQVHQGWIPPSRSSTGSYLDPHPIVSPPPLRRSLANDPAFATDPGINPEHWYLQADVQSTTPFPSHSHSGLDLPHGFVPQSGPDPNTSPRGHSYHEEAQPVYFVQPSISSSSSASDSSASNSPNVRPPRSSHRNSDYAHEHSDSPFRSIPPQYTFPDEGQSHPRNSKHRPKRRSPHSSQPGKDHMEASGTIIPSTVDNPADGVPRTVMSSISPPDLSEHPKDSRVRTSSRPTPPDLDPIDELDETNPYGFNVHHRGPYEAVAAILNETNPIDSPLLRVKGIQQQVSSARVRPSRHAKSEPTANPMSLNLQPGQILPNSIYQPTQPSHFPPEFSRGAHPPSHGSRAPRGPVEPGHGHETATAGPPLRRNQTLPAAGLAQSPPGQSFQVSPHVTSEVLPYQRPYPTDSNVHQPNPPPPRPVDSVPSRSSGRRRTSQMSRHPSELPYASPPSYSHPSQSTGVDYDNTRYSPYADTSHNTGPPSQIAPVVSIAPPSAPATPVEHRFSHTLYLTNPDETTGASGHHTHGPPLPTAPEMVHPSGERQSERPRRSHHASLYGGQPSPAGTRLTDSENRRRSTPRGSPPNTTTTPEQDSPRRFEPPSQTIAAINAQYVGTAPSTSSSSRTSSSLAPRHVPKRLVMPTPLANTAETPSTPPLAAAFSRANTTGRPGQVLRKRDPRGSMHRPQRTQSFPQQTVKSGIFSMFRFGKGSKPVVREVRMMEQPKVGKGEQGQPRVRIREEPRKLSKRR